MFWSNISSSHFFYFKEGETREDVAEMSEDWNEVKDTLTGRIIIR